jgi:hypothetical protein
VSGISGGEVLLDGRVGQAWWAVADEQDGSVRILAGPFPDRAEAAWAAGTHGSNGTAAVRAAYGVRRADDSLNRRPSPQDWAWLAKLTEELERLPSGWDGELDEDDPLVTLLVEVTAALLEAGLPLHVTEGPGSENGGACLTPEPALGGIVVSWRQHDRMSVDHAHGSALDSALQQVMNRALSDVLVLRGFGVESFGGSTSSVVRRAG